MGYCQSRLVNLSSEKKLKILKDVLGAPYINGDEHHFYCPKCEHHKKKLSVNIIKNVFKCWVCDWSSRNVYRIISRYGDYHSKNEWKSFAQEVDIRTLSDQLFTKIEKESPQKIDLPKEFISLANKKLPDTSLRPLNYLRFRGLDKNDIIKWKIGYCSIGAYAGRIIVPSFDCDGDINYFVTRSYDNNWKKYLNPKLSKNIIFNDLYLDFDHGLTIVEGVFDAIKADDNTVPLLGSTLTEKSKLFYEIIKNDTPVYLALDLDAEKKANKLISLFLKYDIEVYKIDTAPYKDIGEMTKSEFTTRKESAVLLNSNNYLLSRIMGI